MNYAVITGDIIQSRLVADRGRLQQTILSVLDQVNQRFNEHIAAAFQITVGDEFQGLLKSPRMSPVLLSTLREMLYPMEVRLSVGVGDITTDLNRLVTHMDGPAFHLARRGIEEIAKQEKRITAYVTNDEHANKLLQALTILSDMLLLDRTAKQWEAFKLYRQEKNLKKVAELLSVKFQNIHKRLHAAHWDQLEQADKLLAEYLETIALTHKRVNKSISPEKG